MTEELVRGVEKTSPGASGQGAGGPSRGRRLFAGWSANLVQMGLGITQQIALIPVFLHYWTSEVLGAWLAIYAAGNLVLIADAGLQFRAINRFLGLKSCADGDNRTVSFYAAMLRIYVGLAGLLAALLLVGAQLVSPSVVLGFQAVPHFDAAFVVMTTGMLLSLPGNLPSGLYRTRGLYGRAVRLQNWAMVLAQLGQLAAISIVGSLLAVSAAYAIVQVLVAIYFLTIEAPRRMPGLRDARSAHSWSWIAGQFRKATPFAVAGATDLALLNLPVLLVSALVSDRVAVSQWALTRVAAGLVRSVCVQITLPLAAELGHDHAVGLKNQSRRLYARGSVLVTLLASLVVSGLLPFWPDFFALWTHGAIPDAPLLTITLLIGTSAVAPSILALGYANYSNRGALLVRTKGLQLAVFLGLSLILIPSMGPLGAAAAVVSSDLLIQFGLLGWVIIRQTLQRPVQHVVFLGFLMFIVVSVGWALGTFIRSWMPGNSLLRFVSECALWLVVVFLMAGPLANANLRGKLEARVPT